MPHIVIEYSANLPHKNELIGVAPLIHYALMETIAASESACKTRLIKHDDFHISNGDPINSFVHVSVAILSGRSQEQKDAAGAKIMEILRNAVGLDQGLDVKASVEIRELQTYFKQDFYSNASGD